MSNRCYANVKPPSQCPDPGLSQFPGNTVAMNDFGFVAMLCEDQTIWIGNLNKNSEDKRYEQTLRLPDDRDITTLEFNETGSTLLLYGPKYLGVIYFPANRIFRSEQISNYTYEIKELVPIISNVQVHNRWTDDCIIKVKWHVCSANHVVVLCLRKTDLRSDVAASEMLLVVNTVTAVTQQYSLLGADRMHRISSFTCGANFGWMRFSIFLTTIRGMFSIIICVCINTKLNTSYMIFCTYVH